MPSKDSILPLGNIPAQASSRESGLKLVLWGAGTGVVSAIAAIGAFFGYGQFVEYFFRPKARGSDILGLEYVLIHPMLVVLVLPVLSLVAVRAVGVHFGWSAALRFCGVNIAVSIGVQILAFIIFSLRP